MILLTALKFGPVRTEGAGPAAPGFSGPLLRGGGPHTELRGPPSYQHIVIQSARRGGAASIKAADGGTNTRLVQRKPAQESD